MSYLGTEPINSEMHDLLKKKGIERAKRDWRRVAESI